MKLISSVEQRRLSRRNVLGLLGAVGAAFGAGCGSSPTQPSSSTTGTTTANTVSGSGTTGSSSSAAAGCVTSPEETAGPYPDKLGLIGNAAYYRQDITEGRSGLSLSL